MIHCLFHFFSYDARFTLFHLHYITEILQYINFNSYCINKAKLNDNCNSNYRPNNIFMDNITFELDVVIILIHVHIGKSAIYQQ